MASDSRRAALQKFIDDRGLKIQPWAKSAGVSEGGVYDFLRKRNRSMTIENLDKLAAAAGVSLMELLGERVPGPPARKDIVAIKRLRVTADMGFGTAGELEGFEGMAEDEAPYELEPIYFQKKWVERVLAEGESERAMLRALDLKGGSMFPTIRDGDIGLFKVPGDYEDGGIYAIWDGHGLIVKRIERVAGGKKKRQKLRVISDNGATFPAYEVEADDVRLIGRLVWRGGMV